MLVGETSREEIPKNGRSVILSVVNAYVPITLLEKDEFLSCQSDEFMFRS
jgi:hypothetical protein